MDAHTGIEVDTVTLVEKSDEAKVTYFGTPSAASFDHPFLPWDSAPFASCLGEA